MSLDNVKDIDVGPLLARASIRAAETWVREYHNSTETDRAKAAVPAMWLVGILEGLLDAVQLSAEGRLRD